MSEMGEMFSAWRKEKQEKRASNRKSSPDLLTEAGIAFESKNDGAHLIVRHEEKTVDFWPGTGLWIVRGTTKRHGGVFKLINFLKDTK